MTLKITTKPPCAPHSGLKLPAHIRRTILELLAAGTPRSEVQTIIEAEYGLKLSPTIVRNLDPRTCHGRRQGRQWLAYYYELLRTNIGSLKQIPGLHPALRFERLERAYDAAVAAGDTKLALEALKHMRLEAEQFEVVPRSKDNAE